MPRLIHPTELTDRSTASQHDTRDLRDAIIEWYERTGQAPRRREFDRDERTPNGAVYAYQWDSFAQARDTILSTHDDEYDGMDTRTPSRLGDTDNYSGMGYSDAELREWIVSWALEVGEPPQRKAFDHATPTPAVNTYEEHFEGTFTEIRDRVLLQWLDQQDAAEREQFPWERAMSNDTAHADD
jgi:hypothetical protein